MDFNKRTKAIISLCKGSTQSRAIAVIESALKDTYAEGQAAGSTGQHSFVGKTLKFTRMDGTDLTTLVRGIITIGGLTLLKYRSGGKVKHENAANIAKIEQP